LQPSFQSRQLLRRVLWWCGAGGTENGRVDARRQNVDERACRPKVAVGSKGKKQNELKEKWVKE